MIVRGAVFVMTLFLSTGVLATEKPVLAPDVCQMMVAYQPAAENNDASYKPGVDIYGRPVVEADLTPSPVQAPESIRFPLTVDLARYAGIEVPEGVEMQAVIGEITVQKGQIRFNDQPIEGEAAAALRALCTEKRPLQKQPKNIYNQ